MLLGYFRTDFCFKAAVEEAAESVSGIVGHDVAPTVEAIEESLNNYEEEHEDEDVFYSFHEFEIA